MTKRVALGWLVATVLAADPARAQTAAGNPASPGGLTVSGSVRGRVEGWNWFDADAGTDYAYLGSILRLALARSSRSYDWRVELAFPMLVGLPDDAIAPGAQGQLGLGASYFAANDRATTTAMLFVKQAFVEFKRFGPGARQSLRLGRMEVVDGTETTPKNATVAALKRDRIAHRLLGTFGFSHVGRSFDGAQYVANGSTLNLTAFGGRPTRGVFDVDGWGELRANVFYAAVTGQPAGGSVAAEWRVFGLAYSDYRDNVLKTDNRPLAMRRDDFDRITIGTFGGHYLGTTDTAAGIFDVVFWGAAQTGSWGRLSHRATAFAAEAGWQPPVLRNLTPWIRGGYDRGSGDGDPNDAKHATFFQVLPTPRVYARFPFFNLMNVRDRFVELILRPSNRLPVRADVHSLRLADPNDLWYSGGGLFQPDTFGYTGRPANGRAGLATLYDISAEYNASRHVGVGLYYGRAVAGPVARNTYPTSRKADFRYLEVTLRF